MARASKAKSPQKISENLKAATASATGNLLKLVAKAESGSDTPGTVTKIAQLTRLCEEAADHMSKAHHNLFDGEEGGDAAIIHLDAALKCLKKVERAGSRRAVKTTKPRRRQRKAKSA